MDTTILLVLSSTTIVAHKVVTSQLSAAEKNLVNSGYYAGCSKIFVTPSEVHS